MNAYELADDLDGWNDDWLSDKNEKNVFKEHANMLRQQADRIAELNEEANNLARTIDGLTSEILGKRQTKQCKDCGEINPAEIHTCSPQTKPLSDEEIIQIFRSEEHTSELQSH